MASSAFAYPVYHTAGQGRAVHSAGTFFGLLERTKGAALYRDDALARIIMEEEQPYPAGGKSSEKTAENIQSRISKFTCLNSTDEAEGLREPLKGKLKHGDKEWARCKIEF